MAAKANKLPTTPMAPSGPTLLFFQEAKAGDVKKVNRESNISETGGGARDLRLNPPTAFARILAPMFPKKTKTPGVYEGVVYWQGKQGQTESARLQLWRPTDARPFESRIGKIYKVGMWQIEPRLYSRSIRKGDMWLFALMQDTNDAVWAQLLRKSELGSEQPIVANYINNQISRTPRSRSVRGAIDFKNGATYP